MADIRRFSLADVPLMARRAWEDVGPELERFLRKLYDSETNGIPAGFNNVTPTDIEAGVAAGPGTETSGWAAADHTHNILTGIASVLTPVSVSSEGVSPAMARADHSHDMSRVMADVMTKVSLGF